MHPLLYKQYRSLINAFKRSIRDPRQLIALLVVTAYALASLGMIVAALVLPLPPSLRVLAQGALAGNRVAQLDALRGGLTLTLLLLGTTSIFQNPLLQFAPADLDVLFATPVPLRRVLLGRILQNHLRTFFAGYFFWGLTAAPALRLAGYAVWPLGAWALVGLTCLFASLDQGFAALQTTLAQGEADNTATNGRGRLWLRRGVLLLFLTCMALLLVGILARQISGNWTLLANALSLAGGRVAGVALLPLGLAGDLLLLPARSGGASGIVLPVLGLLLLDMATAALLVRRSDWLLETALAPNNQPIRLASLLRTIGLRPARLFTALWHPDQTLPQPLLASVRPFGRGASVHIWRRLIEMRRAPFRNGLAVLVLGLVPLALFDPNRGYSLPRLLTAIVFSTSLGTQLFSDVADHLRYASVELAAPISRWRLLAGALLPRLALYWLGGLTLLGGIGLLAPRARSSDLVLLALWYPLVLLPMLALRGVLVFLYPAAGIPGQRDPVQAVLVLLLNGLLALLTITLSLLPFGLVVVLARFIDMSYLWFWPTIFGSSATLCAASWALLAWAYGRYAPTEAG